MSKQYQKQKQKWYNRGYKDGYNEALKSALKGHREDIINILKYNEDSNKIKEELKDLCDISDEELNKTQKR